MTAAGAAAPDNPAPGAPVIDAHQHFWDLSAHDQPWLASDPALAPLLRNFTLADLAPLAAAEGVTGTVVVQTVAESWETPELIALAAGLDGPGVAGKAGEAGPVAGGSGVAGGAGAAGATAGSGLVAGVVGWVDLTAPDIADVLARLRELPGGERLSGIRHPVLVEPDSDWLARPAVLRGLAAVARAGLAYDVVGEPRHLPAAVTAARQVPELRFVLDHLGNPGMQPGVSPGASQPWASAFTQFAALENTTAKLSGVLGVPAPPGATPGTLAHIRPYYDLALYDFGPNRLMFGSDWPPCTLDATYGEVLATARALTADLSSDEQAAIFSGTARQAYKLG